MDQWTNGPMDQWNNGPMDQWTNGPMGTWAHGHMNQWTNGQMDHWTTGPMDQWTKGPMAQRSNGPMDQLDQWTEVAGREIEETLVILSKEKNIIERLECSKSQKVGAGYIPAHHHYKSSCRS